MPAKQPLTTSDLSTIRAALAALNEAKQHVAKAKQAGIPVEAEEASISRLEPQLLAIKRTYFPTEP